jgi:hypothetical protein
MRKIWRFVVRGGAGSFALAVDEGNASNQVLRQMAPVHPVTGM